MGRHADIIRGIASKTEPNNNTKIERVISMFGSAPNLKGLFDASNARPPKKKGKDMRKNRQEGKIAAPSDGDVFEETKKVIIALMKIISTPPVFRQLKQIPGFYYMSENTKSNKDYIIYQMYSYDSDLYGENETDYLVWLESEVMRITHTWDLAEKTILINKEFTIYRSKALREEYNLYSGELDPTGTMIDLFNYWSRLYKMMDEHNSNIYDTDLETTGLH